MPGRANFGLDAAADRVHPSSERTLLGGASALVAAVALVGYPGESAAVSIAGALVVLAAWYVAGPPYAFALGHVALAAVLPEGVAFPRGTGLAWVVAVEAGLLGILLASVTNRAPRRVGGSGGPDDSTVFGSFAVAEVGIVLAWVAAGVALARASADTSLGLPVAAGLLVLLAGVASYGLHRYQLVSLRLVGGGDE